MRRPHKVFLALLIAVLIFLLPVSGALGQTPQLPHVFFGEAGAITINGDAPNRNDLVLKAVVEGVDGMRRPYSISIEPDGSFGGRGFEDPKLKVGGDGNEIASGADIEFFVTADGEDFGPIAVVQFGSGGSHGFQSGALNASLPEPPPPPLPGDDDDDDGAPITSGMNGGGGGTQPTPTPTPQVVTPTPEAVREAGVTPTPTPEPALPLAPAATPTPEEPSAVGGAGAPTPVPPTPVAPAEISPTATPEPAEPPPLEELPADGGVPLWVWLLIGAGVAAAIGGGAIYYLRLRSGGI